MDNSQNLYAPSYGKNDNPYEVMDSNEKLQPNEMDIDHREVVPYLGLVNYLDSGIKKI